jgi:ribosomal protein S14
MIAKETSHPTGACPKVCGKCGRPKSWIGGHTNGWYCRPCAREYAAKQRRPNPGAVPVCLDGSRHRLRVFLTAANDPDVLIDLSELLDRRAGFERAV